jgi:hypothetical protein
MFYSSISADSKRYNGIATSPGRYNLGGTEKADALVFPRAIGRLADILHGHGDGFCDAANRQIVSDGIVAAAGGLDISRLERVPGDLADQP